MIPGIVLSVAIFFLLILAGSVTRSVRRIGRIRESSGGSKTAFDLTMLEEMHARGELTKEEFERLSAAFHRHDAKLSKPSDGPRGFDVLPK